MAIFFYARNIALKPEVQAGTSASNRKSTKKQVQGKSSELSKLFRHEVIWLECFH